MKKVILLLPLLLAAACSPPRPGPPPGAFPMPAGTMEPPAPTRESCSRYTPDGGETIIEECLA
ncbi:hypothetical protein [Pelagovum pacificum]|uniref:Peptidase n=1 Tax=Pelagovum pacificum TaxID=2588711 RepID=A0A5C5GJM4_9RHOB|nr:hypothetical protein [Pelagovum pacificum]TNY34039.1 hypothetical protein FHY64_12475 [Pelagovum pacificum]